MVITFMHRGILSGLAALSLGIATAHAQIEPPKPQGKPDPQMAKVLQSLKELKVKPIHTLNYKQARMQPGPPDAVKRTLQKQGKPTTPEPVASVRDVKVNTPKGAVAVRLYRPEGSSSSEKLPVLVYFHGGGFVIASVSAYDSSCRALANASGAMVAAVAYSPAPEHKLPTAHEQCYAVTQAMLNGAEKYGGDSSKVAVGGESAGGNLTVDMCLMAKMRGGKMPVYQLMVYPFVNGKTIYASHRKFKKQAPLSTPDIPWFLKYAVPNKKVGNSPLGQPLYAPDSMLKGLPPATIIAAELDPLESEGLLFAKKLQKNGVKVRYRYYPGVTHEFFGMGAVVDKAKAAVNYGAQGLKMGFGMQ